MSESIKRKAIPTAAIAVALVLIAPAMLSTGAFAQTFTVEATSTTRTGGLHFVDTPTLTAVKTDGGATLTANAVIAGAGTGAGTATLEADVIATVGCITPSGSNEPRGLQEASATETATAPFEPTRQGRATAEVTIDEITIEDFDFECPSANQQETLVGVLEFQNAVLTIEAQTGTITATFPTIDP